jgi:hypothetical protein
VPEEEDAELENAEEHEKISMTRWKLENPGNSLKRQRILFEMGKIDRLPWDDESKKKSSYMIKDREQQIKKIKE